MNRVTVFIDHLDSYNIIVTQTRKEFVKFNQYHSFYACSSNIKLYFPKIIYLKSFGISQSYF